MRRSSSDPDRAIRSAPAAVARAAAAGKLDWNDWLPRGNAAFLRGAFGLLAAITDAACILLGALVAGVGYHLAAYGWPGPVEAFVHLGLSVALVFVVANVMREDYALAHFFRFRGHARRTLILWNLVSVCALAYGFLTKTTGDISRATILIFYLAGFAALIGGRALLVRTVLHRASAGSIALRRVFLVGSEAEIDSFASRYKPWESGMQVVAAAVLRGADTLTDDLALAAASSRMLRPDDVFILAPWSDSATIDACIDSFVRVPASIHLGPERVLDRFGDARIEKIGAVSSLHIVRRPLSAGEVALKRGFDFLVACAAVFLLLPLFLLVALAIKLESRGPVFFLQRRYGFNQEPFRIVKFRSMHTMDDGRHVPQAQENDPRVTRVGRFLRRANIDELPQLLNVLTGEMSLVGPRPHALAHDQMFEQQIAFYARRHNVKPGITGWAQVNGLRGDSSSEEALRARVEHDLYYIDNWSMTFDLKILLLTIFSGKAYRNAV
ncbi:MAG: exopolysaccharide biosynthesis polyprenyl glycosylphosphotransferase [Hyphomicrobiales bacterium]|nr:exopolysaccharide biosynthesis polyprenyl glycosylphosphotransferase [Hyphomicrobiales bacterium]